MVDEVTIARGYNGPPDSANGGYACGLVAQAVGTPGAQIVLRSPPPLEAAMLRTRDADGGVRLEHGDVLVAEGRPRDPAVAPPPAPSLEDAERAVPRYAGWERHAFPTCFVCGPQRDDHGLRIFPGPVGGDGMVAAPWTPSPEHATGGVVDPVVVWAALDCPSAFACSADGVPVLATMTARLAGDVRAGRPHVVAAWPIGRDGRKHRAGAAVFDAEGTPLAVSEALWIELRDPSAFVAAGA